MNHGSWIYDNGEVIPWEHAAVHPSAHALHYGSSVFEGIRAYERSEGAAIFRLEDHLRRLHDSARLMHMDLSEYPADRLHAACCELVRRNEHGSCYLRPIAFRDGGSLGVDGRRNPVRIIVLGLAWGSYLGDGALERGIDARVSSWRRFPSATMAPMAKIGGQYVNNQLAVAEVHDDGFDEAILLDPWGRLSEGSGENLFLVRDGVLWTPTAASSILAGITRDSVIRIARDLDLEVREADLVRDHLYVADEIFLTGTAAEITPVRSVDRHPVGDGARGPITARLQEEFFRLVRGETADRYGWLTPTAPSATSPSVRRDDSSPEPTSRETVRSLAGAA
ncbi:MAG: branched-chain amino acid transaminase [Thermoanaerobaculia bacterium]|nr:branched-chain amino acid transaminase [Thermoanaerobaculia bacterium]